CSRIRGVGCGSVAAGPAFTDTFTQAALPFATFGGLRLQFFAFDKAIAVGILAGKNFPCPLLMGYAQFTKVDEAIGVAVGLGQQSALPVGALGNLDAAFSQTGCNGITIQRGRTGRALLP